MASILYRYSIFYWQYYGRHLQDVSECRTTTVTMVLPFVRWRSIYARIPCPSNGTPPPPPRSSLQQKLQAESLERLRRESQVQRLHGALRHVLADADSLDCLHPTPLGTPTKPTGLCEADRALPLPCDSTVTILEGGKLAPSGDVPTIAWDK